jgi:hypothetical protein
MNGVPLLIVAKNLGHASTRMIGEALRAFGAEPCRR